MESNYTILAVDDDTSNLELLGSCLTEDGFQVMFATNGKTAIDQISYSPPDLVLLDVRLPDINGYEVCRQLKEEQYSRDIPVIFISGLNEAANKVEGFRAGGVDYLTKPFQKEEVLVRVRTHIHLSEMKRQLERKNVQLQDEITLRQKKETELQQANLELEKRVDMRTSELQKSNQMLSKKEEQLRLALEGTNTAFYEWYPDTWNMFFSPTWFTMLGYEPDEFSHNYQTWIDLLHEDDRAMAETVVQDFVRKKQFSFAIELRMRSKNRGYQWIYNNGAAVDWDDKGNITRMIGTHSDITERKQAEQELRQAYKMESIGNLAGGIAHDFNNILSPIIGFSEILLGDIGPDRPEYEDVQVILDAGKRGSQLVQQILAFSRQSDLQKMPVKVQHVLKEVLKFSGSAIPSDIEICDDIQTDCRPVMADATQLHQIALNLITNAYHAVEKTSGRISLTLKETKLPKNNIKDMLLTPGEYVVLSVSDNGTGISKENLDRIFDPYFTTKERGKGTGLGLATVYGIVKDHNGEIQVETEEGSGSVFRIFLPLLENDSDDNTGISSDKIQLQQGTENILFVDDETSVSKVGKRLLESLGYQVTIRNNSLNALEEFRATPDVFDLVITDMTMPNMTGDILAKKILEIRPNIPILICTGFSPRINEQKAKIIGVKGLLMKPIIGSEMARMVRESLDATDL